MRFLGPTRFERLNEALAFVFLFAGLFIILSLVSYHAEDPSWKAVSSAGRAQNLTGAAGAHISDLCFQTVGLAAFSIPFLLWLLAWRWVRSKPITDAGVKLTGSVLLLLSVCTGMALIFRTHPLPASFAAGGVLGTLLSDYLLAELNVTGTLIVTAIAFIGSLYLISTFSMTRLGVWFGPILRFFGRIGARFRRWREEKRRIAKEKARQRAEQRAEARRAARAAKKAGAAEASVEPPIAASPDLPPWETSESQ